jgi:hypothetical protein
MLGTITYALAAKLGQELDVDLSKVLVSSSEYLLGKVKDGSIQPPTMSLMRTNTAANRTTSLRINALKQGITLAKGPNSVVLKVIPVTLTYSIALLLRSIEDSEKLEISLFWLLEDTNKCRLPIKITAEGIETEIPSTISKESAAGTSAAVTKQEEWDGGLLYRTEFELSVFTYIIKPEIRKTIKVIGVQYNNRDGTVMFDDMVIERVGV